MRLLSCCLLAAVAPAPPSGAAVPAGKIQPIAGGLALVPGPVNGALLRRGGKVLAIYGDPRPDPEPAEMVLFTHHRRDAAWAGRALVARGAKAVVPAGETELFSGTDAFWESWKKARFHDYAQQSSKVLAAPLPVSRAVRGGETIEWEGVPIRVIDTPGCTRGAVSYAVDLAGRRVLFTGDLILGDGKLPDLFSLQDAIPEAKIGGYHGYAARLAQVVQSLRLIEAERPDVIVPSRGPIIEHPQQAIRALIARIQASYANYLSIDALRWYFGDDHIRTKARRVLGPDAPVEWMPMAETRQLPDWIRAIGNTRLILAGDGSGFLVDCGSQGIIEELRKLKAAGTLASLKEIFITHNHDDHTDAAQAAAAEFGAQVHACGSLRDVLEHPADYRLPCLTPNPITLGPRHADGDTWRWKEFTLTLFDFPGQTLYHNALLVRKDGGESFFFIGDTFTPSGVDDYCLQNRNFLREGTGMLKCLAMVEKHAAGAWLINQHVDPAFRFTPAQIARMRDTLRRRRELLAPLFPFDDPDYGLDEGWAVLHPYAVEARPGETVEVAVRITNHSPAARTFRARIHPPAGTAVEGSAEGSAQIRSGAEGSIRFRLRPAEGAPAGLGVATADVLWPGGELREWCEALVTVRRRGTRPHVHPQP